MSFLTDTVIDLVDLFDADVAFANIYSAHCVADMTLPALSFQVRNAVPEGGAMMSGSEGLYPWLVTVSIRVHSSYIGLAEDYLSMIGLVDLTVDKLRTNLDFNATSHINNVSVETGMSFAESDTVGTEITMNFLTHIHYVQE